VVSAEAELVALTPEVANKPGYEPLIQAFEATHGPQNKAATPAPAAAPAASAPN
jgi:hypothetical protein